MPPERVREETRFREGPKKMREEGKHATRRRDKGGVVSIAGAGGIVWRGPDYPLLQPGRYVVQAAKVQGPEWVRTYARWSVRIEFALTAEPGNVSAFFNLGNERSTRRVGRQSRYFRTWCIANGELPRRGQEMSPEVFLNGQFFEVEVENCDRDSEGNPKPAAEVYSRVTKVIRAWTP